MLNTDSAVKRWSAWLPCLALGLVSLLAVGALSLGPPASGPVAALFPPWWSATRAMVAASSAGLPVRFGMAGSLVVLVPDERDAGGRLHRAGAWLLLDPQMLGGCFTAQTPGGEV